MYKLVLRFPKDHIVYALLILGGIIYCVTESGGRGDFYIFLSAASDLGKGEDIYTATYVDGYHYYYSVLFAMLLKPLCALPFQLVKFAWLLFNLLLFVHLFRLLIQSEFVKSLTKKQSRWFQLSVLLFAARFIRDNIHHSQVTILILWCCVYGLYLIHRHNAWKGALLLAIGINIKLLPIVFLPYLIYRGFFRAFALTVLFYAGCLILPSLIIGHQYNSALLSTWFALINPLNQNHVLDVDERTFHGLSTLLSTLLVKDVPDIYALPIRRNIMDISLSTLSMVLLITRLALIAFTLYFTGLSFFKRAKSAWQSCVEISYVLLVIPLIFPHQQPYAFLFAVPACACILYVLITKPLNKNARQTLIVTLSIAFLTFELKLLLGEFNQYYEHFKILTYGVLMLIPALAFVWKKSGVYFLSSKT